MNRQDLERLARSFPELVMAPGVTPFDPEALDRWACGPGASEGGFHAAAFVLNVFNARGAWKAGRFDLFAALRTWDDSHRAAFMSWLAAGARTA